MTLIKEKIIKKIIKKIMEKITLKHLIKCMLILLATAIVGAVCFKIYLEIPSEVDFQVAEGPNPALAELVAIAEKGTPINPDPYAASTYKPGDALYEAMALIQDGKTTAAEDLLRPLVKQGDADAMFWKGNLIFRAGYRGGAGYLLASAKQGNPYAALMLDGADEYKCPGKPLAQLKYCDAKWGELGRKILRERAAQGDARAGYALYMNISHQKPGFDYFFDKEYKAKGQGPFQVLLKAAKDGLKQNYYAPLQSLIALYRDRTSLTFFHRVKVPLTKQEEAILNKVAEIAVNNNDLISISMQSSALPEWPVEAVGRIIDFVGFSFRFFAEEYYLKMAKKSRRYVIQARAHEIHLDNDVHRTIRSLSKTERAEAKRLAIEYRKNYKPIVYIDETYKVY